MGPQVELTAEQTEAVVVEELEYALRHPVGVPEKTYKAIKRAYKWFSPPLRQKTFLRNLKNDIE